MQIFKKSQYKNIRKIAERQRLAALSFILTYGLFLIFLMSSSVLGLCVVHNHSYHNSSHRTHSDKAVFPEAGGSSCRHYELGGVGYFIGQIIEEPVV